METRLKEIEPEDLKELELVNGVEPPTG